MASKVFRSPRPNLIESDDGFSVEILGKAGILYREGDRAMEVSSELLAPGAPYGLAVWKNSIEKWRPPHSDEQINADKRCVILENIRQAIRFTGDDIEVIG